MKVHQVGELGLIRRLRSGAGGAAAGVLTGIGDDTAVLALTPGTVLLATTDLLVEDVHFRRATAAPSDVGWKAVAVNLSDIAAMGGVPRWALVALALPEDTEMEEVAALYAGMQAGAAAHGVVVVGGDTSASPARLMVNVTVLGEHAGTPRLRSMARPGQVVAVTGTLGRSAAGLRIIEAGRGGRGLRLPDRVIAELTDAHRRPTARVPEGRWLAAQPSVHAMMDCSDGLATDLHHVCEESGVGARIALARLPVSPATTDAARELGQDPLAWAATGGEDYELLVTVDAGEAAGVARGLEAATGTPLTVIGEIVSGPAAVAFLDPQGTAVPVGRGFEHFQAGSAGRG